MRFLKTFLTKTITRLTKVRWPKVSSSGFFYHTGPTQPVFKSRKQLFVIPIYKIHCNIYVLRLTFIITDHLVHTLWSTNLNLPPGLERQGWTTQNAQVTENSSKTWTRCSKPWPKFQNVNRIITRSDLLLRISFKQLKTFNNFWKLAHRIVKKYF